MSASDRPKRILLGGYYGFNNAGDEAVLAGLIKAFRQNAISNVVQVTAHSINPASTTRQHGIPSFHRYRPIDLIRSLASCDLFASGGGSLLQDATSAHSIYYYLAVVRIAQIMGKRTMFIAQGIGPLNLARSRRLTAYVANRLSAITVRDDASAKLLRDIGVSRPQVTVTADPAILLGEGVQDRDRSGCALALRPWRDRTDKFAKLFGDAYAKHMPGARLEPMPMHEATDAAINAQLASQLTGSDYNAAGMGSIKELLQVGANCELIVGMRLHSLIFGAAVGTPSLAISYDPKVEAFMRQSGQGDAIYDLESGVPNLSDLLGTVWGERAARRDALLATLPKLRAAAQRNAQIALELLP